MNARAHASSDLRDTHFVRPDGLDAPGHVSSARDVAVLAQVAMHSPIVRELVRERTRHDRGTGASSCTRGTTCSASSPGSSASRRGTRTTRAGARSPRARRRVHDLRRDPRQPDARRSGTPISSGCSPGASSQYRTLDARAAQRPYAWAAAPLRARLASRSSPRKPLVRVVRVGTAARRARSSRRRPSRCRSKRGQRLGPDRGLDRRQAARNEAAAGRALRGAPGLGGRLRWYSTRTGAQPAGPVSRDRHRHPQRGRRPHAHGAELPARASSSRQREPYLGGRQGHQRRARAEAARVAGDRDRSRGRTHRRQDHRGARGRGDPQRLRAHLGRVAHVDGGRRSDGGRAQRDLRVGAGGAAGGARRRCSTSCTTSRVSRRSSSSAARCRATSTTTSTPRRFATSTGAACSACSTPRASRCASASRPSRSSSRRTSGEAESLVGQEFSEDEDFVMALDAIADLGARNVLITQETSCFALFREERHGAPLPRFDRAHRADRIRSARATCCSPGSSPRASTGGRSTRRCVRRSAAPPRRSSSSAPAASTRARRAGSPASVELEELAADFCVGRC